MAMLVKQTSASGERRMRGRTLELSLGDRIRKVGRDHVHCIKIKIDTDLDSVVSLHTDQGPIAPQIVVMPYEGSSRQ